MFDVLKLQELAEESAIPGQCCNSCNSCGCLA